MSRVDATIAPDMPQATGGESTSQLGWLLVVLLLVTFGFAGATGRLTAHHVADTPSYLDYPFDSLESALRSIRTPAYPAVLAIVGRTLGIGAIPAIAWLLNGIVAWRFAVELFRHGASHVCSGAAAFALALGCTALDHQSTIATDAMTASVSIGVVTCLMYWSRTGRSWAMSLVLVGLSFFAIMLRPTALVLIPWIAITGTCLGRMGLYASGSLVYPNLTFGQAIRSSFGVAGGIFVCLLAWVGLRGVVVDDFGVLPFGHQNLAGITIQLVDDEELLAVSDSSRPLVERIVAERSAASQRGFELGDGVKRATATMTLEGRWNDLIYQAVVPAANQQFPGDIVKLHRELGRLNAAIIKKYPLRYVRWLALATRRAAWGTVANWLLNPFFLAATFLAIGWAIGRALSLRWKVSSAEIAIEPIPAPSLATHVLFIVAITYAVMMIGFVILTSPPLGRFADAGAMFIPAWLACRWGQAFGQLQRHA